MIVKILFMTAKISVIDYFQKKNGPAF